MSSRKRNISVSNQDENCFKKQKNANNAPPANIGPTSSLRSIPNRDSSPRNYNNLLQLSGQNLSGKQNRELSPGNSNSLMRGCQLIKGSTNTTNKSPESGTTISNISGKTRSVVCTHNAQSNVSENVELSLKKISSSPKKPSIFTSCVFSTGDDDLDDLDI